LNSTAGQVRDAFTERQAAVRAEEESAASGIAPPTEPPASPPVVREDMHDRS
jgi:hypothetical protein